jgi:CPA2 family monovalent cation:H+ antiporter-2
MTILPDLVILFGIAVAAVLIFRRLQLPSIVGFLMAGILAGPSGFALISTPHHVEQAAEIGVVLLLFTIGIELSLPELRRIAYLLLVGGGLQVGLTILTVAALSGALGFPLGQALFFGFLVALSSTAILAIKRGAEICPNPDPVWQLLEGDLVLTLGTPEQLKVAARLFGPA